jgi:HD-GYP domain-containing protein (c-di-GMP phosphodiesterase class II)/CHASE1-domain containing sensor protein
LESVQAAFNSIQQIDRGQFDELLAPFRVHASSIVAIEWIPRVEDRRRAECENAAKREGIDGFQFTEQNAQGKIVRAAPRNEYFPIYYIGPKPGNPIVFGYDVASESIRYEAICKARDTGKAQASGRMAFIQDEKSRDGFLVLLPVYERGKTLDSLEDRRRNFRGVVAGVFRPDELIETALTRLEPEGIDVALFDSSSPKDRHPFYFHASRGRDESDILDNFDQCNGLHHYHYRSELELAGHHWTIECISIPEFSAARQTAWPWMTLAAGLAFTSILAAYITSTLNRRLYAERLIHEKRLYARGLETKVHERTEELRLAQEDIIQRLVTASLWRDEETGMHIRRTGLMCEALAKAAGWSAAETDLIRQASPMHDVGKIGIPDSILRKPGKLTPKEFEVIKTHTLIGAEMLSESKAPLLQMAREIALCHHEYWDGRGYPMGLAGQQIPETARIMTIIDVYDALTHDRVYRPAMTEEEATKIMLQESGTHFDPGLLALFFTILPEISRLSKEYPDDISNDMKLARDFATILSRSNPADAIALLAPNASLSQMRS